MAEHTPGPWVVSSTGRDIKTADGTVVVAYTYERDAHLIAAAPELLEACDRLVHHFNRDAVDAAMAAIARATGATNA